MASGKCGKLIKNMQSKSRTSSLNFIYKNISPGKKDMLINGCSSSHDSIIFVRYIMVIFNNWNEDWHNDNGNQGPEVIKNKVFHK